MKRTIRLNESKLRHIIMEQVKKAIYEGSASKDVYDKWETIKEMMGADRMLDEVWNFLSGDDIEDFIEHVNRYYDIFPEEDEEEEDEDYDEDEDDEEDY